MSGKVVVIGAGVMGLNAAIQLASDGVSVTVVDRAHPGGGSTGLSAGVYTTQYMDEWNVELRAWSLRKLDELERERGLRLRRIGLLRLSHDPATTEAYHRSIEIQTAHGIVGMRVIGPDEVAEVLPHFVTSDVDSALYSDRDGYLDGNELCALLAEQADELGVNVIGRTRVIGLKSGPAGRAKYTLVTDRGDDLDADIICNCAGAWAGIVGQILEAPVTVVNERHEAYIFEKPPEVDTIYPMMLDHAPGIDADEGLYFRAEGETQIVAGLHSNAILGHPVDDPDDFYSGVTQAAADDIVERFAAAFPALDRITYRGGWAGLYPHSPDQQAVAGPHPANPDILVGGGLGGVGLSLGPVLGRALADHVRYGEARCVTDGARLLPRTGVVA
jgi:sarcosine oxidase, subunit beta